MLSPSPFPGWAPQLLTGDAEIDNEHRLVLNTIDRLRALCGELETKAERGGKPGAAVEMDEVVDLLGDLLAFLVDHFYAEEELMKKFGLTMRDKELCDRHKEDHAAISDTVLRIVSSLDKPQPVSLVMQLHGVLQNWLERHIEIHDKLLVRLIAPG